MTIVRAAREQDRDRIVELIDTSFFHLDANRWLVPDAGQRSAIMRGYFAIHVDLALSHGAAAQVAVDDTSNAIVGVALWYASDDPGPADYDRRVAAVVGEPRLRRFLEFDELLHHHTPATEHDYLGFLAVAPEHQARGIGGRLLREHHRRLDHQARPAYLVASNQHSARLYARHGYQPLPGARYELRLPAGGSMYRMWRTPPPTD
jgi:GNAT superfamily N-acetyltransferase